VDNGFFVADILLKLGIVGTVIGFIIMLSSLSTIDEMNLSKMNNLLLSMSSGMKVALYTTLSGLICSILLTIQNNYFENKINNFISKILSSDDNEKKD
jgi:biopolymer transport protein ExbB/TolQ